VLAGSLWWSWIGFVMLFNRRGDDRRLTDRLAIMAGTVPCGIAATQAVVTMTGPVGKAARRADPP
jgi:hypothetical protein